MNTSHSNYTGRAHRDMKSAFGPYTDHRIYEPVEPMHRNDKIVTVACAVALVSLLAALFIWG